MVTIAEALKLALQHHQAGRLQEAEGHCRRILQVQPDHPDTLHVLGVIVYQLHRHDEAVEFIRRAIEMKPEEAEYHNHLGAAYRAQGRLEEAEGCYRQALALNPSNGAAYYNLGNVLKEQGKLEEAVARYRQALALNPDYIEAYNNLAVALRDQGKPHEAVACFRQALAISPRNATVHSNLIYSILYDTTDAEVIAQELRKWNDLHARPLAATIKAHVHNRDPERRLRVGYVSADFAGHAASFFIEPLLSAHDHAVVEVFLYSNAVLSEGDLRRLQEMSDVCRNIVGLSDEAVADLISKDGIDILVDLSCHTAGNRLLVFARKPAPVQVAYGGTSLTTGLATMDYRLTDEHQYPRDSQEWSSEELVRLRPCPSSYRPPEESPPVSPLPADTNGHVTFASFNNVAKVTPAVVSLWSRILHLAPTSRLMLKDKTFADEAQRARYRGLFRDNGIEGARIELLPRTPLADYLALYGCVDMALDPFPYNGCTTTCESLWMGVPVITLAGDLANGRVGVTLLSYVGLRRLIATTQEDYVRIAVELANNRRELAALRAELRPRMAASPLCNAKAVAKTVEEAYRKMWRRWCRS
jgi:predicted O-linked N-acetylglucosamine transferase (SPINDLY family)